ncbi:allophanate hydrolase subunit 1 [Rhodococcus erythropolis]|uniref:5-oxoprolinase subunit B family protein n=1 Tax=Rhodococcus erythropolis TaxID=1833 RepID=UPI001E57A015|nr:MULTISPECIES: allophanate hydrolase subunit 1 [Rhodococcus erythropolis group]MCD2106387.1 allophanate hydrolase subunit 1 [Rhodococcus qingshengii]MCZ4525734.1 allophanate hydrolase subunit 1 [Rhodococcus erythropolis]
MTGILPAGERAFLVDLDSEADVLTFTEALTRSTPVGVEDFLPAARTVLVTCTPAADLTYVRQCLNDLEQSKSAATADEHSETETLTISVRYNGPDLDDVARSLGMTRAEVVAAHTGAMWRCAFIGFAPGFAYLTSGDTRLDVPRRTQSRTTVPAGSVALAAGYSAVYPRASPGGWQIIGRTDAVMWDLNATPPATVQPGRRVRFVNEEQG